MKARVLSIALILMSCAGATTANAAGRTTSINSMLHIVSDLDKSVEFYRSLFDIERTAGPRPVTADPELQVLYNLPGGREGAGVVRVPGSAVSVELIEWRDVPRTPIERRLQDPGSMTLVLHVRDLTRARAHVASMGLKSVETGDKTRPAFRVRDLDGFVVLFVGDSAAGGDPAASYIVSAEIAVTVEDMDRAATFYRDVFGLVVDTSAPFERDAVWDVGGGVPVRKSTVRAPEGPTSLTFIEFETANREKKLSKLPDPGTPILRLGVRDIAPIVAGLKAAGAEIMTAGGGSTLRHNASMTIARDPNGLYLEPVQPAPQVVQSSVPTPGQRPHVIGFVHFIHATNTLETTVAFYRDVFGIDAPLRPFPNPAVAPLNNVPGIKLRAARPVFPDKSALEITEFTNVDRKGAQAQPGDPGAIALIIPVRDMDVVLAAVKKAGAPILSRSGGPETIRTPKGMQRALVVRDPDGYLAWALEVPPSEATSPGIVQPGVSMVVAVQDLEATSKFYRELGFDLTGTMKFTKEKALADLLGLPATSEYREMSAPIPGTSSSRVSFYEWKGMPRTPFHLNVYDPGAGGFVLRVTDLDGMLAEIKSRGMRVISENGVPVQFSPTSRNVFVVELNGMNLELTESAPAPAQRPGL